MLIEKIDALIGEARKSQNSKRVIALQSVKVALVNEQKSGKDYDESVENRVLSSLVKQYKKTYMLRSFAIRSLIHLRIQHLIGIMLIIHQLNMVKISHMY